jgi:hypothetical protein
MNWWSRTTKKDLPPTYNPDANGNPTDAHDTTLKIQCNGPNTMDLGDVPACDTIDTFTLYKNFMLFEIVHELVTKEEPLYFNPPNLTSSIAKPNSKKRGPSDSKGDATKKCKFHHESFTSFIEATESDDLEQAIDNLINLVDMDKLNIKSITQAELEDAPTASEYMLDKDAYKAAEEG